MSSRLQEIISNTGSTQFPGWKKHSVALVVPERGIYTTRGCQLSPKKVLFWSLEDFLLKQARVMRSSANITQWSQILQSKTPICNSINSMISKYTKISTVTHNIRGIHNAYGSKHMVPLGSIYLVQQIFAFFEADLW